LSRMLWRKEGVRGSKMREKKLNSNKMRRENKILFSFVLFRIYFATKFLIIMSSALHITSRHKKGAWTKWRKKFGLRPTHSTEYMHNLILIMLMLFLKIRKRGFRCDYAYTLVVVVVIFFPFS
jgi:hypothetical protein